MKNLNVEKSDIIQLLYSETCSPKVVNGCTVENIVPYRIATVGREYTLNGEYKVKCINVSPLTFKLL